MRRKSFSRKNSRLATFTEGEKSIMMSHVASAVEGKVEPMNKKLNSLNSELSEIKKLVKDFVSQKMKKGKELPF